MGKNLSIGRPQGLGKLGSVASGSIAIVAIAAVSGCTTLVGNRFDMGSSGLNDTLNGVPFTMNKPTFTVTQTKGAEGSPDKYSIKVDYVPDRTNRYVLRIAPTFLSSIDFTMSFDENGTLTDTTAKVTDQSAVILTSLGKLAASQIGFRDASKMTDDQLAAIVEKEIDSALAATDATVIDPENGTRTPATAAVRAAWPGLKARLEEMAKKGTLRTEFLYEDKAELSLLLTALQSERAAYNPGPSYDGVEKTATSAGSKLPPAVRTALGAFDRSKLQDMKAKLLKARPAIRARFNEDPKSEKKGFDLNTTEVKLLTAALNDLPESTNLLLDLTGLKPADWQARRVAELNKSIEKRGHLNRLSPPAPGSDMELINLQRQKAAVLGLLPEFRRREVLEHLITRSRNAGHFKSMMDEIAFLDKRIADAEAGLKPAAAATPKSEDPAQATLIRGCGATPTSACITKELGELRPTYAISLDSSEGVVAQNPPAPPAAPGAPSPEYASPEPNPGSAPAPAPGEPRTR